MYIMHIKIFKYIFTNTHAWIYIQLFAYISAAFIEYSILFLQENDSASAGEREWPITQISIVTVVYGHKVYQDLYEFLFDLQCKDQKKALSTRANWKSIIFAKSSLTSLRICLFATKERWRWIKWQRSPTRPKWCSSWQIGKKTTGRTTWHILRLLVYKVRVSMGIVHWWISKSYIYI